MEKSGFETRVYEKLKAIPHGKVTSYAELARAAGNGKAYRAVGNALNKNTEAPQIPCHRVVRGDGSLGGYAFGTEKKKEILRAEGVMVEKNKVVDFKNKFFKF